MKGNEIYFLVIVQEGNISKAAMKLGISQPALSSYVANLEKKYETALLDRSTNPIRLTEAGKLYYEYLKKVISMENDFLRTLKDMEKAETGTIVIGGASSSNSCFLAGVTADFLNAHPGINIRIVDGVVSEIAEKVLDDKIDFFITPKKIREDQFDFIPLTDERIFLCIPESWTVNGRIDKYRVSSESIISGTVDYEHIEPVNGQYLKGLRFILLNEKTHVREVSERMFKKWGFIPENPIEISQMMSGLELAAKGAGACFATENVLRFGNFDKLPCIYALDESVSSRKLYISFKKGRYISKACEEYINLLINNFK